mmetsp:Transcript_21219/g.49844  ORF Transcript_21219/g.49844 Transcript_21219/m.49844 type:complete len:412 (+) Transcript_21219:51-1286(+)
MADTGKKISRQVGWLNYNAGLAAHISCSDVLPALLQVGQAQAMKILKDVEQSAAGIENPTAYVLEAAGSAGAADAALGATAFVAPPFRPVSTTKQPVVVEALAKPATALDPTGKIARQVGWLNQRAGLKEKISFTDVVEPLSKIDVTAAMKILKDVEEASSRIEHPSAYIWAAASRLVPFSNVQGQKRTWSSATQAATAGTAPNASPVLEDEKKIARQVGWLNQHCSLSEKISYSDVKEPLEALDLRTAMRLLKDVENMAQTLRNPTAYLISVAKRESDRGNVRGGTTDEAQSVRTCWDFQQGHCPRGDQCRYSHDGILASAPAASVSESAELAQTLGLSLSDQALLELSSIPAAECEEILHEMASGTKVVGDPDRHVSKLCSLVRAEAFKRQTLGGGKDGPIVKRLRLAA